MYFLYIWCIQHQVSARIITLYISFVCLATTVPYHLHIFSILEERNTTTTCCEERKGEYCEVSHRTW